MYLNCILWPTQTSQAFQVTHWRISQSKKYNRLPPPSSKILQVETCYNNEEKQTSASIAGIQS